jgi:hypothetical protein
MQGTDAATLAASLDYAGYGMGWWVDRTHPGVFVDPGAYGSDAWLDLPRKYGGFIAIEGNVLLGAELLTKVKPVIDAALAKAGW